MVHQPIPPFNPELPGDDKPFNTMLYHDVPEGYRISDITIDETLYPALAAAKEGLDEIAEVYFDTYEILGATVNDFFNKITYALTSKAQTFEAFLNATDLLKAAKQNKVVYTPETTVTNEQLTDSESRIINVPFDDTDNDQPSQKNQSHAGKTQTSNGGQDTTEYITDDFTTVKEFLRSNPSVAEEYIKIFRAEFTLRQAYKW